MSESGIDSQSGGLARFVASLDLQPLLDLIRVDIKVLHGSSLKLFSFLLPESLIL